MRQAVLAFMEWTAPPADRPGARLSEGYGAKERKSREEWMPRALGSHCSPPSSRHWGCLALRTGQAPRILSIRQVVWPAAAAHADQAVVLFPSMDG